TLSKVTVKDEPALDNFSCVPANGSSLDPGKSIECTGTHTITQADLDARKIADTACVSATGATEACAPAEVTAEPKPKLGITKKASPETYSKVGDVITYTIVTTNEGNVTLNEVKVKDEPALEGFSCSPEVPTTLAPGKSITCTDTHKIPQADIEAGKIAATA